MFKVGDRVKALSNHESKEIIGLLGTIIGISPSGNISVEFDQNIGGHSCGGEARDGYGWHIPESKLKLVTEKGKRGKTPKPRPVNFLLKYDLDEDPIEEFETMAEVKERIDFLVQNERSLKRESMVIYTIKKKQKVSVKTKITLHA